VTYASRTGSTAEIAQAIGKTLAESNAQVDVRPMQEVQDLAPYSAVVAGSVHLTNMHTYHQVSGRNLVIGVQNNKGVRNDSRVAGIRQIHLWVFAMDSVSLFTN
jgi:flavodoxin